MSERLDRYFALEAADYLDQLSALLAEEGRPDLEQLLRLCRGVLGSAQMAGAETVAAVAERLEEGVRSVQGRHLVWSEEVRQLSLQTVADLRVLVRSSGRWGDLRDERVRAALRQWEQVASAPHIGEGRDARGAEGARAEAPAREANGALRAPSSSRVVEISTLFYDDEGPHVLTTESEEAMTQPMTSAATGPVPIESLLLDREGAIREALSLRDEVERRLRAVPGAEVELSGVVHELFDLLAIAAGGAVTRG